MTTSQTFKRFAGRSASTRLAFCAALLAAAAGCGQETAVTAPVTADASIAADVAGAADAKGAAIAEPKVVGAGHSEGPYVELSGSWSADAQRVTITVWAGDLPNLLGLAAHLVWDPAQLELTASDALNLTEESEASGFAWRHVLKAIAPGRLTAGSARFRSVSHPYAYPEGAKVSRDPWLKLEFRVLATGPLKIGFDDATQLARKAEGEFIPVQWIGATVEVPAGFAIGGAP